VLFVLFVVRGLSLFKGFRFVPELYAEFGRWPSAVGFMVTGAFELFMSCCVERGVLVFPWAGVEGLEAEGTCSG
jgi:hypothetical protein